MIKCTRFYLTVALPDCTGDICEIIVRGVVQSTSTQMSSLSFLALNVLFADETSLHLPFAIAISRAGMLVLGVLVYWKETEAEVVRRKWLSLTPVKSPCLQGRIKRKINWQQSEMLEFLETGQMIKSHLRCAYTRRCVFVSGAAKFPCQACREATQYHYLVQPRE